MLLTTNFLDYFNRTKTKIQHLKEIVIELSTYINKGINKYGVRTHLNSFTEFVVFFWLFSINYYFSFITQPRIFNISSQDDSSEVFLYIRNRQMSQTQHQNSLQLIQGWPMNHIIWSQSKWFSELYRSYRKDLSLSLSPPSLLSFFRNC